MIYKVINMWNEQLWKKASFIYNQAFREKGAKSEKIIRNMFIKQICSLHLIIEENEVIAMALIGVSKNNDVLIIDYLAVRRDYHKQGVGLSFLNHIKQWAFSNGFDQIIIEVESEQTTENSNRIRFWEKCGFTLTEYVHHYIWVPEAYQAMYINLKHLEKPKRGEKLFEYITHFHKESFTLK